MHGAGASIKRDPWSDWGRPETGTGAHQKLLIKDIFGSFSPGGDLGEAGPDRPFCDEGAQNGETTVRKNGSILLACVVALTSFFTTETMAGRYQKHVSRNDKGNVAKIYTVQTTRVRHRCFPGKLRAVLSHIARQVGRRPLVTSGHRSNGRRGSYHRKCLAADIRIPGVSVNRIVAAARSAPAIGGIGTYCNGIVHVDVGPSRRWNYCGGLARLKKRAKVAAR